MSINTVIFSGNLGGDCTTRSTTSGKLIATFSLPVKQGYGEHEKISWVQCRTFGTKAEKLPIYLTRGTKVTVIGQFLLESWTGKDSTEKTTAVVLVNEIDFSSKQERK
ncbi:MAG: single-stranded DNA-binding protein [Candidatus Arsenophonus phytopathogenicus]